MELYEGKEEVLADSYNIDIAFNGGIAFFDRGLCCCAIYIYIVLKSKLGLK